MMVLIYFYITPEIYVSKCPADMYGVLDQDSK